MKKIKNVFLALLLLLMSVALVACNNDAPNVDAGTGGETGGDTDGETGGDTDGETGGNTDGETGGDTDGETDGDTDGETGGDTDGETGGNTDGETGGDTDGETGGDTDGETGGDTDGETGGDTDGETGGNTDGETGGDTDGETDGEQQFSTDQPEYYISNLQKYRITPVFYPDEIAASANAEWVLVGDYHDSDLLHDQITIMCFAAEDIAEETENAISGQAETVLRNGNVIVAGTQWIVEVAAYGSSQAARNDFFGQKFYDLTEDLRSRYYFMDNYGSAESVFGTITLERFEFYNDVARVNVYVLQDESQIDAAAEAYEQNAGGSHYRVTDGNLLIVAETEQDIAEALGNDVQPYHYVEEKDTSAFEINAYYQNIAAAFDNFNIVESTYNDVFGLSLNEYAFGQKYDAAEDVAVFTTDDADADRIVEETAAFYGLTFVKEGDVFIVGTPWAVSVAKGERDDSLLDRYAEDKGVLSLIESNRDERILLQYGVNGQTVEIYIGDDIAVRTETDEQTASDELTAYIASDNCNYEYVLQKGATLIGFADGEFKDLIAGDGTTLYDVFEIRAQQWAQNGYAGVETYLDRLREAGERAEVRSYSETAGSIALSVSDYKEGFVGIGKEALFVRAYAQDADAEIAAQQAISLLCVEADGRFVLEGTPWAVSTAKGETPTADKGEFVESLGLEGLQTATSGFENRGYNSLYVAAAGVNYDGATAQYKIEIIAGPDLYDTAYYGMIVSEFESAEDADAFADQICSQGGADGYSYMFVSGNVVIEADMTYGASVVECLSDMPDVKVYMKSF